MADAAITKAVPRPGMEKKGRYPAGKKPVSQLKPPPDSITRKPGPKP